MHTRMEWRLSVSSFPLGKRFFIFITLLLVVVPAGVVWRLSRPREPEYQGKPISAWMKRMVEWDGKTFRGNADARVAIRALGTNAVPQIIKCMGARDYPFTAHVLRFRGKGPGDDLLVRSGFLKPWMSRMNAIVACQALGSDAIDALPGLLAVPNGVGNMAIGSFGHLALPVLALSLTNQNKTVRFNATTALQYPTVRFSTLIKDFPTIIPDLISNLSDTDPSIRTASAQTLGILGPRATSAVPALVELSKDKDAKARSAALQALNDIDPESARALSPQ
jgi:hypothetical protein